MNYVKKIFLTTFLAYSTLSIAAPTLHVPDGVTLYVVNGEPYDKESVFLFDSNDNVKLKDGDNQLVFKYKTTVKQGSDDIRTYDSDAIIAKFNTTSPDAKMIMPNYWSNEDAQKGIKNLSWGIKDNSGKDIAIFQDTLPSTGIQLSRDYVDEAKNYNNRGGVAAIDLPHSAATMTASTSAPIVLDNKPVDSSNVTSDKNVEMQSTTLEMLNYWYSKADTKTREQFIKSIGLKK